MVQNNNIAADYPGPLPTILGQLAASGPSVWSGMIRSWLQRGRQRRALGELDDRLLCDIGVTRSQALREAAKPFWSAGRA